MKFVVKLAPFEFEAEASSIHEIAAEVNDLFALMEALRSDYPDLFAAAAASPARNQFAARRPAAARQPVAARPAAATRRPAASRVGDIVEEAIAIVTEANGRVKIKTASLSRYGVLVTEATSIEPAVQALIPAQGEIEVAGVRVAHDGKVALSVFAE